jgi:GT2 family glycosyltransferase
MKITVGIASIRANTVEAAARSICRQTWSDWELLIVGQGPEACERTHALKAAGERLEEGDSRIKYVHLAQMGVSKARNEFICRAQGEIIAIIDDDCEADPDWLAVMGGCLQDNPSVGLVGGALVATPLTTRAPSAAAFTWLGLSACPTMVPAETLYDPTIDQDMPPPGWDWVGASVAMRADAVAQVGLFDEFIGPGTAFPGGEDTDYKLRLEAAGIRMMATPRAVVRHTYGHRVGLRVVARSSRAYARGAGAVAAKLTLAGDPRGLAWVRAARRDFWRDLLRPRRSPAALYRLPHLLRAYREVLAGYTFDPQTGWLQPKAFSDQRFYARSRAWGGGT